jgi:hypothetical protein
MRLPELKTRFVLRDVERAMMETSHQTERQSRSEALQEVRRMSDLNLESLLLLPALTKGVSTASRARGAHAPLVELRDRSDTWRSAGSQ